MAQNVSQYTLEAVLPDVIDNSIIPTLNITRLDCLNMCYWSVVCATIFFDETKGDCYVSNRLYTLLGNHPKLSSKVGVTGYQWTSANCPTDKWSFHKPAGYCLMYKGSALKSFSVAKANCISEGGRLVNIMTSAQNAVIGYVAQDSGRNEIWIGLKIPDNQWHLGETVVYTAWKGNPPSSNCAVFESASGLWTELSCSQGRVYICEKHVPNACAL